MKEHVLGLSSGGMDGMANANVTGFCECDELPRTCHSRAPLHRRACCRALLGSHYIGNSFPHYSKVSHITPHFHIIQ
eukprot:COSAG01_NODE_48_length_31904_cov_21.696997_37_plen_77_part_00